MKPTISVKIKGGWVSLSTLPQEQQALVKSKVAEVLQNAINQQIALMVGKKGS